MANMTKRGGAMARRAIIAHWRAAGLTLADIGKKLGISKERVRQLTLPLPILQERPIPSHQPRVIEPVHCVDCNATLVRPARGRPPKRCAACREQWQRWRYHCRYSVDYLPRRGKHGADFTGGQVLHRASPATNSAGFVRWVFRCQCGRETVTNSQRLLVGGPLFCPKCRRR